MRLPQPGCTGAWARQ